MKNAGQTSKPISTSMSMSISVVRLAVTTDVEETLEGQRAGRLLGQLP